MCVDCLGFRFFSASAAVATLSFAKYFVLSHQLFPHISSQMIHALVFLPSDVFRFDVGRYLLCGDVRCPASIEKNCDLTIYVCSLEENVETSVVGALRVAEDSRKWNGAVQPPPNFSKSFLCQQPVFLNLQLYRSILSGEIFDWTTGQQIKNVSITFVLYNKNDMEKCEFLCCCPSANLDKNFVGLRRALFGQNIEEGIPAPKPPDKTDALTKSWSSKAVGFLCYSSFFRQMKDRCSQLSVVWTDAFQSKSTHMPIRTGNILTCVALDILGAFFLLQFVLAAVSAEELLNTCLTSTNVSRGKCT